MSVSTQFRLFRAKMRSIRYHTQMEDTFIFSKSLLLKQTPKPKVIESASLSHMTQHEMGDSASIIQAELEKDYLMMEMISTTIVKHNNGEKTAIMVALRKGGRGESLRVPSQAIDHLLAF